MFSNSTRLTSLTRIKIMIGGGGTGLIHFRSTTALQLIDCTSSTHGVSPTTLKALALQHLPRKSDAFGLISFKWAQREVERLALQLLQRTNEAYDTLNMSHLEAPELSSCELRSVETEIGSVICDELHYLGMSRATAAHWGLFDPLKTVPFAYCCVSPLGLDARRANLSKTLGHDPRSVFDLARVYVMPFAPKNSISFMLSRLRKRVFRDKTCAAITTVVDPNLGFTGSSYRAAGWNFLTLLPRDLYAYVRGDFWTYGRLKKVFGTCNRRELQLLLGDEIEFSKIVPHPALVFGIRNPAYSA